jgi:signal transduction histidine kinase/CheY-like chemotaxis protein/type II secretory pathway pseudopilin PulG
MANEPGAPQGTTTAGRAAGHNRQRYRLVLIVSMALLGVFLAAIAIDAYRSEYARQLQLQQSRIAGVGARIEEIADVARTRVIALRHMTELTYAATSAAPGSDVPPPPRRTYLQAVVTARTKAQQAYQGTILASALDLIPGDTDAERAWRQDYRVFRALWLAQAGLHAASPHIALSYVMSARTGATANFPALAPSELAMMTDPNRPQWHNPLDLPFLRKLSPSALPGRELLWLPVYYDPTSALARIDADVKGDGRVISLVAPVDVDGEYRAGVGIDIWAEEMARILRGSIPGTNLTLVDGAGLVIATTRPEARHLKAKTLGEVGQATHAAAMLQVAPSILRLDGLVRTGGQLLFVWPVPNSPLRLVAELRSVELRKATLLSLGPLIGGATLLYLLLCLAIWYVTQRVFEPAFALAEHIQSLGSGSPPRLPGYWARVLDVTQSAFAERRRFEEELARQREALHQSEKMTALGTLLAGVAHELNNPLAVVVGRSAILAEALEGSPYARGIGKLRDAADRCSRIVKTFLAMARQSGPRRATVDINDLVESALDVTGYGLRTGGIAVTCALDPDLPLTHADGDQIVQVLMNLIINAQHALAGSDGSTERRLTITTGHDQATRTIWITIADSGPGVPSEIGSRIFDPFFTTKQIGQGTGMGLAVSRGMAEGQGGRLELLASDQGAVFRLTLPVMRAVEEEGHADISAPAATRSNLHALIIDDEAEVGELIRDSLKGLFAVIDLYRDGSAALRAVEQHRYDLILSDLRMPGLSGIELYKQLVRADPELGRRFIVISGDIQYRRDVSGSPLADLPVLEKPFGPAELRAFVSRILATLSHARNN